MPAAGADIRLDGVGRPFAQVTAVEVDAADAGLRGKGNELGLVAFELVAAQPVLFLRQDDDAASLGRFIGQRGQLRGVGQLGQVGAVGRDEFDGLPIAQRDRARLVQEQHIHVAGGFHGATDWWR